MVRHILLMFSVLVLTTACTTTDEIIIDRKGINMAHYDADLADCKSYAGQVATGEKVVRGAASGAVVGGAIGAVVGGRSDAATGAGVGAITGGARGVSQGEQDKVRVVKNCLRGRGYRVLN